MADNPISQMETSGEPILLKEEDVDVNDSNFNALNMEGKLSADVNSNMEQEEEESISIMKMLQLDPPPEALPDGWITRRCNSHPGYVYYFHQHTGQCNWESPAILNRNDTEKQEELTKTAEAILAAMAKQQKSNTSIASDTATTNTDNASSSGSTKVRSILKKRHTVKSETADEELNIKSKGGSPVPPVAKKSKSHHKRKSASSSSSSGSQIRCLHILKKHSGSRNPYSWRYKKKQAMIQLSKKGAVSELKELLEILSQSNTSAEDLRATFEELARTESDCSSARKGGDLGYFGKGAMQPAFEKACFVLKPGKMSGIVSTDSGVHVILRLA